MTRGIENNNPLNIRKGNNWEGEIKNQTDRSFEQFQSMIYGLRAGFIILRNYINKYNCDTITKIISKWAPPTENDTKNYIKTVSDQVGINSNSKITWNYQFASKLLTAMCKVESGYKASDNELKEAFKLI